jgi:hypothetical protein
MFGWLRKGSRRSALKTTQQAEVRQIEMLEDRLVPTIDAPWEAVGPGRITNGQVENIFPDNDVVGAVQAVAPHPTNPNIVFVGGVNGGIWRTTNALDALPTWTPLTDELESLSISDLRFNPNDSNVMVASIGRRSSLGGQGTELSGLLITRDAGATWTELRNGVEGENFAAVVVSGTSGSETIIAVSTGIIGGTGGVFRSTDGGATFSLVLTGSWGDVILDPNTPGRVWVAGLGENGIRTSTDGGATFTDVTEGAVDGEVEVDGDTDNIKLGLHSNGVTRVLYVGVVNAGQFGGVFFTSNEGGAALHDTWTAMDLPLTNENGVLVGLQPVTPRPGAPLLSGRPGGQGSIHFSLVADPNNPNLVYVGGDRQEIQNLGIPNSIGATDFTGRLFRGNRSVAPVGNGQVSPQWTTLTHIGTISNSAPHADSRDLAFNSLGQLVEGDDGGIYRRTNPTTSNGDWISMIGDLQITEYHSVDYDALTNTAIGGAQDTGTSFQVDEFNRRFDSPSRADGGVVQIDDSRAEYSIRYTSNQGLFNFTRRFINADGIEIRTEDVGLLINGTTPLGARQFYQPYVLNTINPDRMLIGTNILFESFDRGDTLRVASPNIGTVTSMVYGGSLGGVNNAELIYASSTAGFFLRESQEFGLQFRSQAPGGLIRDIAVDPDDWRNVFIVDENQVWQSVDAGLTWTDVTGSLSIADDLQTIVYVRGPITDGVVIGGDNGVARALTADIAGSWEEVGPGLLPNAEVRDLRYDEQDDVLLAGLLGRGAFRLRDASGYVAGSIGRVVAFDLSQSMIDTQSVDIDGDGKLTDADDFDGDGLKGTPLDQALYSFERIVREGNVATDVTIVIFGRNAQYLDMSLTAGFQITASAAADSDGNGVADAIDIVRTLRVAGGGYFNQSTIDASNTFLDPVLNAAANVPDIGGLRSSIFTDGSAIIANNSTALDSVVALDVSVDFYLFGPYRAVGSLSAVQRVAVATGGVITEVAGNRIIDNAIVPIKPSPSAILLRRSLGFAMDQATLASRNIENQQLQQGEPVGPNRRSDLVGVIGREEIDPTPDTTAGDPPPIDEPDDTVTDDAPTVDENMITDEIVV